VNGEPLRLEADDPAVLERTGRALEDSVSIRRPPLRLTCHQCGHELARVGDTAHGPLFVSSWEVPAPEAHVYVVNGERLRPRAAHQFMEQHTELIEQAGPPMGTPFIHGVTALLALPAGMTPDYPDLLVRCNKHGDKVLDRIEVIAWLRAVKPNHVESRPITVRRADTEDGHLHYRESGPIPGPQRRTAQSETRRIKTDAMPIPELERRLRERYRQS
jgi:hypothetical protein